MSAKVRLAKLEGALSPKAATLRWLTEAHQFPTLPTYVAWLVDQPAEAAPFWRVPEQAERAVRAAMRGEPRSAVESAAHQAVRDAVFLVELVIRLNVEAAEALRIEGLRYAAFCCEARTLAAETGLPPAIQGPRGRRALATQWTNRRDAVSDWTISLEAAKRARQLLERQYLDGRDALFPDVATAWGTLIECAEHLTTRGEGDVPAGDPRQRRRYRRVTPPNLDGATAATLAADLASGLVERARSVALGLLADPATAAASAARCLRSRS